MPNKQDVLTDFQWKPQPAAEAWVRRQVEHVRASVPGVREFAERLQAGAAVRLLDIVDTIFVGNSPEKVADAVHSGWGYVSNERGWQIHRNERGMFPAIGYAENLPSDWVGINFKVESVAEFVRANRTNGEIIGMPGSRILHAVIWEGRGGVMEAVERHGWRGLWTDQLYNAEAADLAMQSIRERRRSSDDGATGFEEANLLIDRAIASVGRDVACHLFFKAEREYWQSRNSAGQAQYERQQRFGLGWANHDHHTYRCSRQHFTKLIAMWEKLGFHCRERFYAGREAGWGAQVMEQPNAGIVTFNDVDLSPEELTADFAHEPLSPRDSLGTVGLWCALHGESFLQAGMHHLECQFDFDALKQQLESESDVRVMKPFTNYPYLRQAFTEGERWPVDPKRIDRLLAAKLITAEQAEQFRTNGAIGSHLENLERNQGFKGFNQQGVSEIIAATDPRRHLQR